MAWLTVREAAKWLEISEPAVRQRIQRNTLKHSKCPNGRVYVYRDDEQDDKTDEEPRSSGENNNANGQRSWWDYAAVVSGLVVLFGALIYALGLFALWVPIARVYTHDATTAWHAAFLVPRTVVAGLGTRQLVALPLVTGVVIFAWLALWHHLILPSISSTRLKWTIEQVVVGVVLGFVVIYGTWLLATGSGPLSHATFPTILSFVITSFALRIILGFVIWRLWLHHYSVAALLSLSVLVFAFLAYFGWRTLIASNTAFLQKPSDVVIALGDTVIVVVAIAIILEGAAVTAGWLEDRTSEYSGWARVRTFIPIAIAAFVGAFLLTCTTDAPLPVAKIAVKDKDQRTVGALLTHVDSFWYVFEERENQPGSKLTAIPDDEVKTAWISTSQ